MLITKLFRLRKGCEFWNSQVKSYLILFLEKEGSRRLILITGWDWGSGEEFLRKAKKCSVLVRHTFVPNKVKVLLQGGEEELLWDLASNSHWHRAQYGKVLEKLLSKKINKNKVTFSTLPSSPNTLFTEISNFYLSLGFPTADPKTRR